MIHECHKFAISLGRLSFSCFNFNLPKSNSDINFVMQGFDIPAQLTSGLMSIATASASALCSLVVSSDDSMEAVDLISDRNTSSLQDLYGSVYHSHHRASKREIELRLARRRYERAVERRSVLSARRQGIKASLDNLQAQSILVQAQIDDLVAETAFLKSSSARKGSSQGCASRQQCYRVNGIQSFIIFCNWKLRCV